MSGSGQEYINIRYPAQLPHPDDCLFKGGIVLDGADNYCIQGTRVRFCVKKGLEHGGKELEGVLEYNMDDYSWCVVCDDDLWIFLGDVQWFRKIE